MERLVALAQGRDMGAFVAWVDAQPVRMEPHEPLNPRAPERGTRGEGPRRPPVVTPPRPQKRERCRSCRRELPAWLPVAQEPDGPMRLHHLSAMHPTEVGPYLARMRTEDIVRVAAEAYEVVQDA